LLFVLLIFVQMFLFASSGMKAILFIPVFVLLSWFYVRRGITAISFFNLASISILIGMLPAWLFDNNFISSVFTRRILFSATNVHFAYFDYFSNHDFVFWSNSILKGLVEYPYDIPLPNLIGWHLYNNEQSHANSGFIASGFAHFGFLGVVIYSIIFGFILRILRNLGNSGIPLWLVVALTVLSLRSAFVSSDLLVALITHGLMIVIAIMYLTVKRK